MHYSFPSEARIDGSDSQFPQSPQGFLEMLYRENDTENTVPNTAETEHIQHDTQEQETQAPPKKRAKVSKQKVKTKKKSRSSSTTANDIVETKDEEEGTKRGPNWKEHWIVNLIHLRGTMHDKFSGMKKQGVDNWGVLLTQLVAACLDFDRSSDACWKKWKKIYDDYKADYTANGISGNDRSTKCKWYYSIDQFMHDRVNVFKHVHGSAQDEDPNSVQEEGHEICDDSAKVPEPTASTSQIPTPRKSDKIATQEAIAQMAEQSKKLADAVKESEAAKLVLLQGMLATMNNFVKKL